MHFLLFMGIPFSFKSLLCFGLAFVALVACSRDPKLSGRAGLQNSNIELAYRDDNQIAPPIISDSAPAAENAQGTMDGGGADFIPDADLTAEDVHSSIDRAKENVPFVLRFLDATRMNHRQSARVWNSVDLVNYDLIMDAFFKERDPNSDIYDYFEKIQWEIHEDRPCLNEFGEDKAASSVPTELPIICLSVPMILKDATRADMTRRLTAIIVHELLHKRGLKNEALAIRFEQTLNSYLPIDTKAYLTERMDRIHSLIYFYREEMVKNYTPDLLADLDRRHKSITGYSVQAQRLLKDETVILENEKLKELIKQISLTAFALSTTNFEDNTPLEFLTNSDFESIKKIQELGQGLENLKDLNEVKNKINEIAQISIVISDHLEQLHFIKSFSAGIREMVPQ